MARRGFNIYGMESDESFGSTPETEVEVAEVGDVAGDIKSDTDVLDVGDDFINRATNSLSDLEAIPEMVENAGGEVDAISAESIDKLVKSIMSNIGVSRESYISVESFRNPKNRQTMKEIALEGVADVAKDVWRRIKAAFKKLIEKVKAFWNKHVSSLGRVKKALESMKSKVSESSGKLKSQAYIEDAPTSLIDAFAGSNDISPRVIDEHFSNFLRLAELTDSVYGAFNNSIISYTRFAENVSESDIDKRKDDYRRELHLDNFKNVKLMHGVTVEITVEDDDGVDKYTIEKDKIDDKEAKLGVSLSEKKDVTELLSSCLKLVNECVKYRDKSDKLETEINKQFINLDKAVGIDGVGNASYKSKRNIYKSLYQQYLLYTQLTSMLTNQSVLLSKAVINYAALCVKNYK